MRGSSRNHISEAFYRRFKASQALGRHLLQCIVKGLMSESWADYIASQNSSYKRKVDTMNKEDFAQWLKSNRTIKEYSANRYANAIVTIASEIEGYGLEKLDLFNFPDTTLIDRILMHPEFRKKDSKGNRMYSVALKHFKTYINQFNAMKLDKTLQFEISEEGVQCENEEDNDKPNKKYEEGKVLLRLHKLRERDPQLIKDAKERFKKLHGELFCEACGINFEKMYGERGKDFIEGHHKKPVSEMKEGETTKVEDIGMLCSNCHRMIHRIPMISIEELKRSLKLKWEGSSYSVN